ncbi:hypothetical protein HF521_020490 [Silurus meridionalis]|uniref:Tetratricopeptide repeat protein n=1 Tax=Silurus meridionalis TaxID=175797 RepID=A0A8T0BDS1_SILME|nr:hypothetical protein HF521_020490 [Silurus meridionalis]
MTTMSLTEATLLQAELHKLECHFTWKLKKEELDLTDLLNRLEQHADFNLGEKAGLAQTYNSLGYVKHLLGSSQDALGYLQKCVELTKESRLDDCDKWLIVPYGNLAWLQYQLKCFSELLGEKAWAYFKFSRKYYNQAKECFEKVLELEHMNAEWNCGYAFVLHRTETQCPSVRTINQLRQAIDTNPDNDELKALLAVRLGEA